MSNKNIRKEILKGVKRVVIKVGSSIIAHREDGKPALMKGLDKARVRHLAGMVHDIAGQGIEVVLVSSGAVMAGRERLGLDRANLSIPQKQACAAIGQSFLMHTFEKKFESRGLKVAQILLDHHDLENRQRFLNARHTLEALMAYGVIPIVNENDTVTVDEIKIGDNDTLSATVACLVGAQMLIILSDVDGLYSRDPLRKGKGNSAPPELISLVDKITADIEKKAGKSKSALTVGGMYTKVLAAKKTISFGIPALVVNGLDDKVMDKIFSGETVGTLFWAGREKISHRKHWIAHTLKPAGTIRVDPGAKKALVERGKSLLPAGVVGVDGKFEFGNSVRIVDEKSEEIARGLANYSSADLARIKGMKTSAVRNLVGDNFYEEVVHRDDLVIL